MAGFEDMPDEILVEVFRCLTYEKATLRSLVTVNKRMSLLAIQTLAYAIDIFVQTEDNALSLRYDLLMASLDRCPELSVWPREITIRCEKRCDQRRQRREHPNIRANKLLLRLPKIKSLSIDWADKEYTFLPAFLRYMGHPHLKVITFLAGQSSLNQIGAFKTTASLSSIVAKNLDPRSKLSFHPLDSDLVGRDSPRLKLMDLGRTHIPHIELHKLFEIFPTVTTLNCAVPGREKYGSYLDPSHVWMASYLAPSLIAQAFAPLQEGLVNLRLNYRPITIWPGRDNTPMDLRDFKCLKVLHVPSACYFGESPEAQRNSVRTLLPPSLEEFKLWFDFGDHFLYTKDELPRCFPNGRYSDRVEVEHPERYAWLSELVGANLPDRNIFCLRKVTIEERIFMVKSFYYARHFWELPSALHELCNDAEVTLEVRLRKLRRVVPD